MTYNNVVENVINCRKRWFAAIEAEEAIAIVWTNLDDFRAAADEQKLAKREYQNARKLLREYKIQAKNSKNTGILAK